MPLRSSRLAALVVGAAVAVSLLTSPSAAAVRSLDAGCPSGVVRSSGFLDVAGSAHERGIACLVHWGVASGTTLTRYAPSGGVTRAQMAAFLARAVQRTGGSLPTGSPDAFDDDDGSVHEPAINALAEAGVVSGRGGRSYEPGALVSRAQMAALLVRAFDERSGQAGQEPLAAGPDAFPDDEGADLEPEIDRAAAAGLVAGYPDGTYRPAGTVTREAMASFVARWLDLAVSRGLTTAPSRPASVRVVAVGDIACPGGSTPTPTECQQAATADLAQRIDPEAVLLLGDIQYPDGSVEQFAAPGGYNGTWSRLLDRTYPAPGNHEWQTPGAEGYRSVFDGRTGGRFYYSADVGGWHLISLDSSCGSVGGCGADSPMVQWLRSDLAANDGRPTLVFWHRTMWSTGRAGDSTSMDDVWRTVEADRDVQLALASHDHDYERFGPLDAGGVPSAAGLPSIVAGTGGKSLYCERTTGGPASETFDCSTAGVLALGLRPDGYDFEFVPIGTGGFTDAGTRALRPSS